MKVIVAGSASFFGYSISKRLLELNYEVIGIDNPNDTEDDKFKILRNDLLLNFSKYKLLVSYKNDPELSKKLEGETVDYVIDVATKDYYYSNTELSEYSRFLHANVIGTSELFELAVKLKAKKFIYESSHGVYGNTKKSILTEKEILPKPNSPHGASNLAGEKVVEFLSGYHKLPALIFRPFTVYGPYLPNYVVVYHFLEMLYHKEPLKMYTDIDRTRDFLYITDFVNFIISSLDKRLKFQVINLASGESHSLREVAYLVAKAYGLRKNEVIIKRSEKNFSHIGAHKMQADISKAVKLLSYKPQVTLEEGIRNTVNWYVDNKLYKNRYHPE